MRSLSASARVAVASALSSGDLESGAGSAIRGMTEFPRLMALGATGSTELAYQYGRLTALEARKVGFDWNFGPVADLYYNWLNPAWGSMSGADA